ncbi:MAG TPA: biotin--[acetyl-CoA-carboxylase] ligase [Firmicutes bacterium]|nr:biotin--[acetyl-CoA-carboxylase] ligase [Bacillota bacterium]
MKERPLRGKVLKRILTVSEAVSTNLTLYNGVFASGTVLAAEKQTGGKGRYGSRWVSKKGGAWFSYIIKGSRRDPEFYVMVSSVAVCAVLRRMGINAEIKKPNDILAGGKKICGILAEHSAYDKKTVVGIGINVNNPVPKNVNIPAVSIKKILKKKIPPDKIICTVLKEMEKYLSGARTRGDLEKKYECMVGE